MKKLIRIIKKNLTDHKDYYLKARNTFFFLLILVIIFYSSYWVHENYPHIDMLSPYLARNNNEGLFWIYSSLAQSVAALFAVSGMFVVFRLQTLQTEMMAYFNSQIVLRYTSMNYPDRSFEEILERMTNSMGEDDPPVVHAKEMLTKRGELRRGMKKSLKELSALFLFSFIMMYVPFSKSYFWILFGGLILTLLAILFVLKNIGLVIYRSLN